MNPLEYYDKANVKSAQGPGDYVRVDWGDGYSVSGVVAGALCAGDAIHLVFTSGVRVRLQARDRVEIVSGRSE
jgi:hypothetical protein